MKPKFLNSAKVGKVSQLSVPPVPPGFASLTAFTLRRKVEESKEETCNSSRNGPETDRMHAGFDVCKADFDMFLNRRPWLLYDQFTQNPGELNNTLLETQLQRLTLLKDSSSMICLPKEVIRGGSSSSDCQKVTARWNPGDAHVTKLEEVPVFRPTEEEFKDMLKYISSIYPKAKKYGICRIVPPSSWKPPCLLEEKNQWDSSTFMTYVQHIHELWSPPLLKRKRKPTPRKKDKKRRKGLRMNGAVKHVEGSNTDSDKVETLLEHHKFEPGCEFTLESFKRYADNFKNQYFSSAEKTDNKDGLVYVKEHFEPTLENIEGEYNRIIENPTEDIKVLYGADIDTRVFGSGFPKAEYPEYTESDWNLNNVPKLPGSILAFASLADSSILTPKLCMGMCFSSVCWNVVEHHLYAMSYMHVGSPRIWYGSSGIHSFKFESALKKNTLNLDSHKKSAIQIPPSMLKSQGIPVYRCVQNPGEFVFVLPGSYHASFDCGFNCSEKAYFAPIDWILHGLHAAEVYHDQRRKTLISIDKLLISVAMKGVEANWENFLMRKISKDNRMWMSVCKKDGILTKALKGRIEQESTMRDHLFNKSSKSKKMNFPDDSATTQKMDCSICCCDLHFSAVFCSSCSPQPNNNSRYACLIHAEQLCSCPWTAKHFMFRYSLEELNLLLDALKGKITAIYKCVREVFVTDPK